MQIAQTEASIGPKLPRWRNCFCGLIAKPPVFHIAMEIEVELYVVIWLDYKWNISKAECWSVLIVNSQALSLLIGYLSVGCIFRWLKWVLPIVEQENFNTCMGRWIKRKQIAIATGRSIKISQHLTATILLLWAVRTLKVK